MSNERERGVTHYEGCWNDHHACARIHVNACIAEIDRLKRENDIVTEQQDALGKELTAATAQSAERIAELERTLGGQASYFIECNEKSQQCISELSQQIFALTSAAQALVAAYDDEKIDVTPFKIAKAIQALRTALASPVQGETVRVPPFDADVEWILGRPCFAVIGIANALRAGGATIARKAEAEQAAVLHWMLTMYAKHGKNWREEGNKALAAAQEPKV